MTQVMALPFGRLAGWAYAYFIPGKDLPLSFFFYGFAGVFGETGMKKTKGVQTHDGNIRVYRSQQILVVTVSKHTWVQDLV